MRKKKLNAAEGNFWDLLFGVQVSGCWQQVIATAAQFTAKCSERAHLGHDRA